MATASYTTGSFCAEHSYLANDISIAEVASRLNYMYRHRQMAVNGLTILDVHGLVDQGHLSYSPQRAQRKTLLPCLLFPSLAGLAVPSCGLPALLAWAAKADDEGALKPLLPTIIRSY
jgi:hypothetical protein